MDEEIPDGAEVRTITDDLSTVVDIVDEIIHALSHGPRTRERSIVITKLQEAVLWAVEAHRVEVHKASVFDAHLNSQPS